MFGSIDRVLGRAAGIIQDRQRGQDTLFGMLQEQVQEKPQPETQLPEWPQHQLLAHEKELLGFYVTGHPLTPFVSILEQYASHKTSQLGQLGKNEMARVGGLVAEVKKGISKKSNKPYAMMTLEDLEGSVQVLCMNENYDQFAALLLPNKALLVIGEVNNSEDKPKIFPQEILPLEDAPKKFTKQVHFRLQTAHLTPGRLEAIRDIVQGNAGTCPLLLCLRRPGGEIVFIETDEKFFVTPSMALQTAVEEQFGEQTYYAKVDTSPPQRPARQRERQNYNGNGEQ